MTKLLTGGCLCEALRYECHYKPKAVTYCHCDDCRKANGCAFNVGVEVDVDTLNIVSGHVKEYTKTADSGNKITREFCPECGSPLFTRSNAFPSLIWIKAGSLDEPELIKPTHQIWTERAVSWSHIDDDLPSFPQAGPIESKETS